VFTLSGFGDEISPDLNEQLDLLESEGVKFLELRGVWNKNVLDLSDKECARVKAELDRRGFGVSAIGSPIGKAAITDPFAPHLARFRHTLDVAEFFRAPYIRLFSFYVPPKEAAAYRAEVMRRMQALGEAAAGRPVTLGIENEHGLYGDTPERSLDLIRTLNSPQWTTVYDPCNYVMEGLRPFQQAFPMLADTIGYVHIKDADLATRTICVAGQGDGHIPETLAALKQRGYDGFLSLEPHLLVAGVSHGETGPELFRQAIRALKGILGRL
jgi:sugar phosphate isomerase/epimerase